MSAPSAGGAAAGDAPVVLLDQSRPFVRMAVVGCGNIARSHLAAIVRNYKRALSPPSSTSPASTSTSVAPSTAPHPPLHHIGVTCLCDPNPTQCAAFAELVASTTGLTPRCFSSLEQALAEASDIFDSVNICVPNDLHEAVAVQAFQAGKHVLLEKPIALNVASAQRILHAAEKSGKVFMVAENAQYWKEILVVDRCIKEQRFGTVVSVRAKCWETIVNQNEWQGDYAPGLWRSDPARAGGGYVFDSASHWIRPLRMWCGDIAEVVAVHGRCIPHMKGESFSHALFKFKTGLSGSFEAMLAGWAVMPQPWFVVECTGGELVVDGDFGGGYGVKAFTKDHPQGLVLDTPGGWDSSYEGEMADFASAVLSGSSLHAPAVSALQDLKVLIAMFASADKGAWVKVDEVQ